MRLPVDEGPAEVIAHEEACCLRPVPLCQRRELEEDEEQKDYRALCQDILFLHPERYTIAKDTLSHISNWRGMFIKTYGIATQAHYKKMYEGLLYGDPKSRILRILWTSIFTDYNTQTKGVK